MNSQPFLVYMDAQILGAAIIYERGQQAARSSDAFRVLEMVRTYCPSRIVLTETLWAQLRHEFPGQLGIVASKLRAAQSEETNKFIRRNRRIDGAAVPYIDLHRELVQDALAQQAHLAVSNLQRWLVHAKRVKEDHGLTILPPKEAVRMINNMRGTS